MRRARIKRVLLRKLPNGTRVRLLRPNLWAGFEGVVTEAREEFQIVRVTRMEGSSFEIGAHDDEMEVLK